MAWGKGSLVVVAVVSVELCYSLKKYPVSKSTGGIVFNKIGFSQYISNVQ